MRLRAWRRLSARRLRLRALLVCLLALWMRRWVWGLRLRVRWRHLVVLWERFRVQWMRGGVWFVVGLRLDVWRLLVPVLGSNRWRVCNPVLGENALRSKDDINNWCGRRP